MSVDYKVAGLASCLLLGSGLAAMAQPASAPAQEGATVIEEVVVQARRRDESQQDVPVAISVVGGAALREQAVNTTQDLVQRVPGLQVIPSTGRRDTVNLGIRSQLTIQSRLDVDPAVGVYFSEVNIPRPYGMNQGLYDLASVQVLKGPQGTLFGRNSTGGAILYQPNRPTNVFEGMLEGEIGSNEGRVLTGVLNVPVSDRLQVRLAGRVAKREGFTTNILNGQDLDDVNNNSLRLGVLFKPTDNIENYLVYDRYRSDENGAASVVVAARRTAIASALFPGLQAAFAAQQARGLHDVALDGPNSSKVEVDGVANITTVQLGGVTLKNIVGWRRTDLLAFNDFDGTPFPIVHVGLDGDVEQVSEEFQVSGKSFGDSLNWIAGLYYFKEEGSDYTPLRALGGLVSLKNGGLAENTAKSAFAQGTYAFPGLPQLSVTLGARYTADTRSITFQPILPTGVCAFTIRGVPANPCSVPGKADFNATTWTAAVDYKVSNDLLIYAATRKGYRSGGFNLTSLTEVAAFPPFRPETVTDVEVGVKSDWVLGGVPLRANVAVYRAKGVDLQRAVRVGTAGTSRIVNAAEGEFYGAEFEGIIRPLPGLSLSAFASYDHSEYNRFETAGVDVSGSAFPSAPENTLGLSGRYERALPGDMGGLVFTLDYYSRSRMFTDPISVLEPESRVEGYQIANARVEWKDVGGRPVSIAGFVRNLTDEQYATGGVSFQRDFGVTVVQPGDPRTYGVQLQYRFGG